MKKQNNDLNQSQKQKKTLNYTENRTARAMRSAHAKHTATGRNNGNSSARSAGSRRVGSNKVGNRSASSATVRKPLSIFSRDHIFAKCVCVVLSILLVWLLLPTGAASQLKAMAEEAANASLTGTTIEAEQTSTDAANAEDEQTSTDTATSEAEQTSTDAVTAEDTADSTLLSTNADSLTSVANSDSLSTEAANSTDTTDNTSADTTDNTASDTQEQTQQDESADTKETTDSTEPTDSTDNIETSDSTDSTDLLSSLFGINSTDSDNSAEEDDEASSESSENDTENTEEDGTPSTWDFSVNYAGVNVTLDSSSGGGPGQSASDPDTLVYGAQGKYTHSTNVGTLTMSGADNTYANNNSKKSKISEGGFAINYGKLDGYDSLYKKGGYATFTVGDKDLASLSIDYSFPSHYDSDRNTYYNVLTVSTNSYWKNSLAYAKSATAGDGGTLIVNNLTANTTYYIFSFTACSNSWNSTASSTSLFNYNSHPEYGGVLISKIVAKQTGSTVGGSLKGSEIDIPESTGAKLIFKPTSSTTDSAVESDFTYTASSTTNTYTTDPLPKGVTGDFYVKIGDNEYKVYTGYTVPDEDTTSGPEIDLSSCFATFSGSIANSTGASQDFYLKYGDWTSSAITVENGATETFSNKCAFKGSSGDFIVKVGSADDDSDDDSDDDENSISSQKVTIANAADTALGTFTFQEDKTITIDTDETHPNSITLLTPTTTYTAGVASTTYSSLTRADSYKLPYNTSVKYSKDVYNSTVYYKDTTTEVPSPFTLDSDKTLSISGATYVWSTYTENEVTYYQCTATFKVSDTQTITETCKESVDGQMTTEITKRPSTSQKGLKNLTANFPLSSANAAYFSKPTIYDVEFEYTGHTHDEITFENEWTSDNSLPSSGSYYLTTDVTISSKVSIASGSTLQLCLNGHYIKYSGSSSDWLFDNEGTLTLADCEDMQSTNPHYFDSDFNLTTSSSYTYKVDGGVITGGKRHIVYNKGTLNSYHVNYVGNANTDKDTKWEGSKCYFDPEVAKGAVITTTQWSTIDIDGGNFIGNSCNNTSGSGGCFGGAIAIGTFNAYPLESSAPGCQGTIKNCTFSKNEAYRGGAIYAGGSSTVVVKGCSITDNYSYWTAAGIFCSCTKNLTIIDTNIENNVIGDCSDNYGWGAGICANYDGGTESPNYSTVTLGGKVVIQNNINNNSKEHSSLAGKEDNLCLEAASSTKVAKLNVLTEGEDAFEKESSVGVNILLWGASPIAPTSGQVTTGYSSYYNGTSTDTSWKGKIIGFYADNILDPDDYSILIGTDSKEIIIGSHTHEYNYQSTDTVFTDKDTKINTSYNDTLSFSCTEDATICQYNTTSLNVPLKFIDGYSVDYDEQAHTADLDEVNLSLMRTKTGTKLAKADYVDGSTSSYSSSNVTTTASEGIAYYDASTNTKLTGAPTSPGIYYAKATFFCFEGTSKTSPTSTVTITSDNFTINKNPLTLYLTCNDKTYTQDANSAPYVTSFSGYTLDGVKEGDTVGVDLSTVKAKIEDTSESKYKYCVGTYNLSALVGTPTLTGDDASKYTLESLGTSTVNIVACDNDLTGTGNVSTTVGNVFNMKSVYQNLLSNKDTTVELANYSSSYPFNIGTTIPHNGKVEGYYDSTTEEEGLFYIAPDAISEETTGHQDAGSYGEERCVMQDKFKSVSAVDFNGDDVPEVKAWPSDTSSTYCYVSWYNCYTDSNAASFDFTTDGNGSLDNGASLTTTTKLAVFRVTNQNSDIFSIVTKSGENNVTAKPNTGYTFDHWTIKYTDASGTEHEETTINPTYQQNLSECAGYDFTIKAYFSEIPDPKIAVTNVQTRTFNNSGEELFETEVVNGKTVQVPADANLNENVLYDITVKNTGNVTLYNPQITIVTDEGEQTLTINLATYGKSSLDAGEEYTFTYDDVKDKFSSFSAYTYKHNVVEDDILYGSLRGTFGASATTATSGGTTVNADPYTLSADLQDIDTSKVTATITSSKGDGLVYLGDTVTYTITITNNGNITMTSGEIVDTLLEYTGDNTLKVPSLAPGQSYTVTTKEFTVDEIEGATAVVNTIKFNGKYEATTTSSYTSTVSVDASCSNNYGYLTVDLPTVYTGLVYNGLSQTGINTQTQEGVEFINNSESNCVATDAGTYTAQVKKGTWYKWSDPKITDSVVTLTWEIAPAKVTIKEINGNGNSKAKKTYDGDKLSYDLCLYDPEPEQLKLEVYGWISGSNRNDMPKSMTLVTNSGDAGNYVTKENSKGTLVPDNFELKMEYTKGNTLDEECFKKNYEVEYKGINLVIDPISITDNDEISVSADNRTYNTKEQETNVVVAYSPEHGTATTLVSGTDYEIDTSSITKATNYKKDGYTVKVNGIGNYTGSKTCTWYINKAKIKIGLTGNSATKTYNGTEQYCYGCSVTSTTLSENITLDESKISPSITSTETSAQCVAKGTNKGTYKMQKKVTDASGNATYEELKEEMFSYADDNIEVEEWSYAAGILTINEKTLSDSDITITFDNTITYNGDTQTATFKVYDTTTKKYLDINNDYTIVEKSNEGKDATTYTLIIKGSGNYDGQISKTWTIEKADLIVSMTAEQIAAAKNEFNAQSYSYTYEMAGKGTDKFSVTVTSNGYTAQIYTGYGTGATQNSASVQPGNDTTNMSNYKDPDYSTGTIQTEITRRDITVKAADYTTTYTLDADKNPVVQSLIDANVTWDDDLGEQLRWDSTTAWENKSRSNAGNQQGKLKKDAITIYLTINNVETDVTANYNITSEAGTLTVNPRKIALAIKGTKFENADTYVYSGTAYSKSSASGDTMFSASSTDVLYYDATKLGVTDSTKAITVTGTNAGTYNLQYAGHDLASSDFVYNDSNVEIDTEKSTFENGYLKIEKKTIDVKGNGAYKWDGNRYTYTLKDSTQENPDVTGVVAGEKIGGTLTTNDSAEGEYNAIGESGFTYTPALTYDSGALESNYQVASYRAALNISKEVTVNIVGEQIGLSKDVYYDAQEHKASGYTVTTNDDSKIDKNLIKLREGYTTEVKATAVTRDTDGNVAPHMMNLTEQSFYYDSDTVFVKFVVTDGGLCIKPRALTKDMVTATKTQQTYCNANLSPVYTLSYEVTSGTGEKTTVTLTENDDYTLAGNVGLNVDSYSTTITGKGNYTGELTSANTAGLLNWQITPAPITINIAGHSGGGTYNGEYYSCSTYTATCSETTPFYYDNCIVPASGDSTLEVKRKEVGTTEKPLTSDLFKYTYLNDNGVANVAATFKIDSEASSIKVVVTEKASTNVTATITPQSNPYTGKTITPTISVKDGEEDLLYGDNPQYEISSDSTTSATDYGTYPVTLKPVANSNYKGEIKLTWEITQLDLEVEITPGTNTVSYNGNEQSYSNFEANYKSGSAKELFKSTLVTYTDTANTGTVKGTDANTYTQAMSLDKFKYGNSNINTKFVFATSGTSTLNSLTLIIDKVSISQTVAEGTTPRVKLKTSNTKLTYDSIEKSITSTLYDNTIGRYLNADGRTEYTIDGVQSATNANDYSFTIKGCGNYKDEITVNWEIDKLKFEVSIVGNTLPGGSVTYDGESHTVTGYTATEKSNNSLFKAENLRPVESNYTQKQINAGTYALGLPAADSAEWTYTDTTNIELKIVSVVDGKLVINKKELTLNDFDVKVQTLTYNGTAQSNMPTVTLKNSTNPPLTYSTDYTLEDNEQINAGTGYKLNINGCGNYTGSINGVEWAIDKLAVTFNITANSDEKTYDGTSHSVTGFNVSVDSHQNLVTTGNVKYDGKLQTEGPTVTGTDAKTYTSALDVSKFSYADDNISPSFVVDSKKNAVTLNIIAKDITITAHKQQEYKGDTSPFTYTLQSSDITGLLSGHTLTGTLTTSSGVAGDYSVLNAETSGFIPSLNFASAGGSKDNYNITYNVLLTITVADSYVITINAASATVDYDGTNHTISGYTTSATFSSFDESELSISSSAQSKTTITEKNVKRDDNDNVEAYSMGLESSDFTYTGEIPSGKTLEIKIVGGTLTISPKSINSSDVVVDSSFTTTTYDGKTQNPGITLTDKGIGTSGTSMSPDNSGRLQDYKIENNTGIDAGTYNVVITGTGNYTGTRTNAPVWTIKSKELIVSLSESQDYNRSKFTYTYTNSIIDGETVSIDFTTNAAVPYLYNVDDATGQADNGFIKTTPSIISTTGHSSKLTNYSISYGSINLTINQRPITLTPTARTTTYNGQEQSLNKQATITEGTLVDGDAIDTSNITFNPASKKEAGEYDVYIASAPIIDNTSTQANVSAYYNISYGSAKLTINSLDMTIKVSGGSKEYTYSGSPCVLDENTVTFTKEEVVAEGGAASGVFDALLVKYTGDVSRKETEASSTPYTIDLSKCGYYYDDSSVNVTWQFVDPQMTIKPKSIEGYVTLSASSFDYNQSEQTTSLSVLTPDKNIFASSNYEIVEDSAAGFTTKGTKADTYTAKIKGVDNYTGELTCTWNIYKVSVTMLIEGNNKKTTYTGSPVTFPYAEGESAYSLSFQKDAAGKTPSLDYTKFVKEPEASKYTITQTDVNYVNGAVAPYYMNISTSDFECTDTSIDCTFQMAKDSDNKDVDGYLLIQPCSLSGYSASTTAVTYNKTEQTAQATVTNNGTTLEQGTDFDLSGDYQKTAANEYKVNVVGKGNYTGTINGVDWKINKAVFNVEIEGASAAEFDYTRTAHSVSGYKVVKATSTGTEDYKMFSASDILANATQRDNWVLTATDAGEYSNNLMQSDFKYTDENCTVTFVAATSNSGAGSSNGDDAKIATNTLKIKPVEIKVGVTASQSWKDNESFTYYIQNSDLDGIIDGDTLHESTITTSKGTVGEYKDPNLTYSISVNGVTIPNKTNYNKNINYYYTSTSKLTITDKQVLNVTWKDQTVTYDGLGHTLTNVEPTIDASSVSNYSKSKVTITYDSVKDKVNAGTYAASNNVTYADDLVYINVIQPNLVINKRPLSTNGKATDKISVNLSDTSYTYDRTQHVPTSTITDTISASTTIAKDTTVSVPSAATAAGSYDVTYTATDVDDCNYTGSVTATYTINKASRVIKIEGDTQTNGYDGEAHVASGYTVTELDGEGKPLTEGTPKIIDGVIAPAKDKFSVSQTDVGKTIMDISGTTFTYTASDTDSIDYKFSLVDGYSQVDYVYFDSVTYSPQTFTYNGESQGPTSFVVKDKNGKEVDSSLYDVTGNTGTDAGTYTITITGKGNYSGTAEKPNTITTTFTIEQAKRTVNIIGHYVDTDYDGTEHSAQGYDIKEVCAEGEEIVKTKLVNYSGTAATIKRTVNGQSDMGLEQAKFSYGEPKNIDVTFALTDGYVKINKVDINDCVRTIEPTSAKFDYNTQNQKPVPTIKNGTLELAENTDYVLSVKKTAESAETLTDYKNVGTYYLIITPAENSNYTGDAIAIPYEIQKVKVYVDINGSTESITYDNVEHTTSFVPAKEGAVSASVTWFDPAKLSPLSGASWSASGTTVYHIEGTGEEAVTKSTYDVGLKSTSFVYEDDTAGNTETVYTIKSDQVLKITQKNITDSDITIKVENVEYTGLAQGAKITIMDTRSTVDKQLIEVGTSGEGDYQTHNNSQTAAGDYQLNISGMNNYCGTTAALAWSISKANVTVKLKGYKTSYDYDTKKHDISGYDYSITSYSSESAKNLFNRNNVSFKDGCAAYACSNDAGDAGTYYMSIYSEKKDSDGNTTYVSNAVYSDSSVAVTFADTTDVEDLGYVTINPLDISSDVVSYAVTDPEFNGYAQLPGYTATITLSDGSTKDLDPTWFSIADSDKRVDVPEEVSGQPGSYTVTLKPNNKNFKSDTTKQLSWAITPKTVNVTVTGGAAYSAGNKLKVNFDNMSNFDWKFSGHKIEGYAETSKPDEGVYKSSNEGDLTFTITKWQTSGGVDYPALERDYNLVYKNCELTISSKLLSNCTITYTDSFIYNGQNQQPTNIVVVDGSTTLTLNTDYTLDITPKKDANKNNEKYSFSVVGKGNYAGSVTKEWTITPRPVTVKPYVNGEGVGKHDFVYKGTNNNQQYVITLANDVDGNDFEVATSDNDRGIVVSAGDGVTGIMRTVATTKNTYGTNAGSYDLTDSSGTGCKISISTSDITATGQTNLNNYTFAIDSTSALNIAKKDVTIHPETDKAKTTFNGEQYTYSYNSTSNIDSDTGESKDIEGVVYGESIYGSFTTNKANAGTYEGRGTGDTQVSESGPTAGANTILGNYYISYGDIKLTIEKASLSIKASVSVKASKQYDGSVLTYSYDSTEGKGEVEGLGKGDAITGSFTTSKDGSADNGIHSGTYTITDTGEYRVHVVVPTAKSGYTFDTNNYDTDITYSVTLKINANDMIKKDDTTHTDGIDLTDDAKAKCVSLVYNGKSQSPDKVDGFAIYDSRLGTTALANTEYEVKCVPKIDANVDGQKYTFTICGKAGSNYSTDKSISFEWEITPLAVTITPNAQTDSDVGTATQVYNGKELSYEIQSSDADKQVTSESGVTEVICGNIVTNEVRVTEGKQTTGGDDVKYTFAGMTDTKSREYKLSASNISVTGGQAKKSNYNISYYADSAFTITKRKAKLSLKDEQKYNNKRFSRGFDGNNFGDTTQTTPAALQSMAQTFGADNSYAVVDSTNDTSTLVEGESFTGTVTTGKNETEGKDKGQYYLNDTTATISLAPGPSAAATTDADNYSFDYNVELDITAQNFNSVTVTDTNKYTYSGTQQYPGDNSHIITVFDPNRGDNGETLVSGTDYDVIINEGDGVDAGTYTGTIKGKGNYEGAEKTITWTISPAPLTINATKSAEKQQVYNGSALVYEVDTSATEGGADAQGLKGGEIIKGTLTTTGKDKGTYYYGSADSGVTADLKVYASDGKTERKMSNYTQSFNAGPTQSETNINFTIKATSVKIVADKNKTYDGKVYESTICSLDDSGQLSGNFEGVVDGEKLTATISSTLADADTYTTAKGTAKVSNLTAVSSGALLTNYTFDTTSDDVKITIGKLDVSNLLKADYAQSLEYNGELQRPVVNSLYLKDESGNTTSLNKSDFTVSGDSHKDVSTSSEEYPYTLTITANDNCNYSGSIECKWKIAPREITIAPKSPSGGIPYMDYMDGVKFEYTVDTDLRPSDVVNCLSNEQVYGTFVSQSDVPGQYGYDDDYPDSKTINTEGIKFGDGVKSTNYSVKYQVWLQIDYVSIKNDHIEVTVNDSLTYNGAPQKIDASKIKVTYYGYEMELNSDYEICAIEEGENVGSYSVSIKGLGAFTKDKDAINDSGKWYVTPRNAIVCATGSQVYNGKALTCDYDKTMVYDYESWVEGEPKALSSVITDADTKAAWAGSVVTSDSDTSATGGTNAGTYTTDGQSAKGYVVESKAPYSTNAATLASNYSFVDYETGNTRYDCELEITSKSIKNNEGEGNIEIVITDPEYNGESQQPGVEIVDKSIVDKEGNPKVLVEDDGSGNGDFKLEGDGTDAGTYDVVIRGEGNYSSEDEDTVERSWKLTARKIALDVSQSKTYDSKVFSYDYSSAATSTSATGDFKHVVWDSATSSWVFDEAAALVKGQAASGTVVSSTDGVAEDGVNVGEYVFSNDESANKIVLGSPEFATGTKSTNYEFVTGTAAAPGAHSIELVINARSLSEADVVLGDMVIYDPDNPQEQSQPIDSVTIKVDDENKLVLVEYDEGTGTGDYVIGGDIKGLEPGVYHMVLEGTGNYTGKRTVTWVVVGTTDEDIAKIDNGEGRLVVDTESDATSPTAEINTSKADMIKMLSDANELAGVADGDSLRIWIKITDESATIGSERPTAKSALDFVATGEGVDVASYNDISLFKTYTKLIGPETTTTQVHDTKNPVDLTLTIPDALRPGADIASRVFGLIRYHEGEESPETKKMDTQYSEESFELDFASDKFSDYALTKVDTLVPAPDLPDAVSSGKTGDMIGLAGAVVAALMLAMCGLAVYACRRKKINMNR